MNFKDKYISFKGKKYALNFEKLMKICFSTSSEGTKEYEISQVYETDTNGEMNISSKIEHETKSNTNPQNDMIAYDMAKMLIATILENNTPESEFTTDLGTMLAINTLVSWGILEEK